jgi:hypothetical protein
VRNVPLWRETEWKREDLAGKGKVASWGKVFVLSPCVGDHMTDSSDNHISRQHMVWI